MSAKKSLPRKVEFRYYDEDDNEVVHKVRKLPLGRSAELAEAFNELPKVIKGLMEGEETKVLFGEDVANMGMADMAIVIGQNLGPIMQVALDSVIKILEVGSGLDRAVIELLGLDEASELFLAIVTVNNLNAMQANLKNAMSLLAPNLGQKVQKQLAAVQTQKSGSKTS